MRHELSIQTKVKAIVPPIVAKGGDTVAFSGGVKGRAYFFPDKNLFPGDLLRVEAGKPPTEFKINGKPGTYRYAVWDEDAGDFLEGNSSPIIIVQP